MPVFTEDDSARTTALFDLTSAGQNFIQDVLHGGDRFVPNKPGPLRGPADPPKPKLTGPGDPNQTGFVRCSLVQKDDDVTTRELHLVAIGGGRLVHGMLTNFSEAKDGSGFAFNRFNTVSQWEDLSQVLGMNFGTITSAAIVALPSRAISVFFMAEAGGVYRLWHTVRFASGS